MQVGAGMCIPCLRRRALCFALSSMLLSGCSATTDTDPATSIERLRASQTEPYAVPAIDDLELAIGITFAPLLWGKLTDTQLLEWARCWRDVRDATDRPSVRYAETAAGGGTQERDLFLRSARDGFCVAEALTMRGPVANERVRTTLERILAGVDQR